MMDDDYAIFIIKTAIAEANRAEQIYINRLIMILFKTRINTSLGWLFTAAAV